MKASKIWQTYIQTNKQIKDKQTDKQKYTQTNKKLANKETNNKTDRQIGRQTDILTNIQTKYII